MCDDEMYGTVFLSRLRELTGLTPANYRDQEEIQTLNQEQLSRRMQKKSYVLFQMIRDNPADTAAEIILEHHRTHSAGIWRDSGGNLPQLFT
ncbi:MAG: hypothetical protein P8J37_11125 [Fuerstiella sp.]|jgi:hypothetical protein|nr:hypothetical protein [Fuerstiella sp.]